MACQSAPSVHRTAQLIVQRCLKQNAMPEVVLAEQAVKEALRDQQALHLP